MPQFVQKLWVVNTRVVDLAFMYVYLCIYMFCIYQFFIKKKKKRRKKVGQILDFMEVFPAGKHFR